MSADLTHELGRIKAPTQLIWGNRDQFASASEQKALLAVIPHARLAVYEGVGHSPHWEDPDRFVDDVVEFVYSL